jgi:2-dehydro-3-deoxyphosphooctonate aldolase (KDO 8-P synthase)
MNKVKLDNIIFGDSAIPFIGGPCVIESRDHCFGIAEKITEITSKLNIPFVFKRSFYKDNRKYISSFCGVGLVAVLKILE